MGSLTRSHDIVYPVFANAVNSYPIDIGDYAWGAIIMADSISFNTLDFNTAFADKSLSKTAVPGTLIPMRDENNTAIAQITSVGADESRLIPVGVFQYKWLILTVNTAITSNMTAPELLLVLKG